MRQLGRLSSLFSVLGAVAFMAAAMPSTAVAQDPAPPVCDVNETSPTELSRAFLALQGILGDTVQENVVRGARTVMGHATTNIQSGSNMPGRNFIMARTMIALLGVNFPELTTRGEIGITTTPAERVDLVAAADSLFTLVAASNPSCAYEIQNTWRFSQVWVTMLQRASAHLEADRVDSAEHIVKRAQLLERSTPYTWQMLATIASRRDAHEQAIEYWKKTYETAAADTSNAEIKFQALFFLGETNLGIAHQKQGAEAVTYAREAARYFQQFLDEGSGHRDAAVARANLATAYMTSGDTARVAETYQPLLANPRNFTSAHHLQAGVAATHARLTADAVKLFTNALHDAPWDRDILFNLCISLFSEKDYLSMLDPATRLVNVDPNNPDNFELLAFAYATLEAAEQDAAKKTMYADSLSKYNPMYDAISASHAVNHTAFMKGETETTLRGYITNRGAEDRAFKLEYDFLDRSGNAVATGEADVGVVKAGAQAEFRVTVPRGGILFYRGKPIPPPGQSSQNR